MACTYDTKSYGETTGTSLTVAHTIGGGSNRLLLVVECNELTTSATTVKYNTVDMTKLYEVTNGMCYSVWYMLEAALPTAGARNIVAAYASSRDCCIIGMSVSDCLQAAPGYTAGSGTGTSATATRTFAAAGSVALAAAMFIEDAVISAAAGETLLDKWPNGSYNIAGASRDDRDAGSQTMTLNTTAGSSAWKSVIVELGPVAAAGSPRSQVIWIPTYTA